MELELGLWPQEGTEAMAGGGLPVHTLSLVWACLWVMSSCQTMCAVDMQRVPLPCPACASDLVSVFTVVSVTS